MIMLRYVCIVKSSLNYIFMGEKCNLRAQHGRTILRLWHDTTYIYNGHDLHHPKIYNGPVWLPFCALFIVDAEFINSP